MVPIVRKQANALLAAPRVHGQRFHYFDTGMKRLIIELELEDAVVFLVHLSLKYRTRQEQLRFLHDLVRASTKPVILAGDFNTFFGEDEMFLFREATGLRSANVSGLKTYPSHQPRMELDFILYGEGIEPVDFRIPQLRYSDHLPLVFDFTVRRA
jgi:endonuclease/exonuclease/phosphatase family metal-dependent hydrolase